MKMADSLPWFGEEHMALCERAAPSVPASDIGLVQRVLLSWLVGRPISAIAKRARCSPRFVYQVVRRTIYAEEPALGIETWVASGVILIPAVLTASPTRASGLRTADREDDEPKVPLYCGVCHRLITRVWVPITRLDGRILTAAELEWNMSETHGWDSDAHEAAIAAQAHLTRHFRLNRDPIGKPRDDEWNWEDEEELEPEVAERARRTRLSRSAIARRTPWQNLLRPEVIQKMKRGSSAQLLPLREGREMSRSEAINLWKNLFSKLESKADA
ncbi:MAG: hypothetical protein HY678_05660 [Chloroflexi bacterium]|nr:hypothetical protein [Chloroflexota bacterium]